MAALALGTARLPVTCTAVIALVALDDKVIMFANPEDAAEYIDFDLQAVS